MVERFTVDGDGRYWDRIKHEYVTIDYLFKLVGEQDELIQKLKRENIQLKNNFRTWGDKE